MTQTQNLCQSCDLEELLLLLLFTLVRQHFSDQTHDIVVGYCFTLGLLTFGLYVLLDYTGGFFFFLRDKQETTLKFSLILNGKAKFPDLYKRLVKAKKGRQWYTIIPV